MKDNGWICCDKCKKRLYIDTGARSFNPQCLDCRLADMLDMWKHAPSPERREMIERTYDKMLEYNEDMRPRAEFLIW